MTKRHDTSLVLHGALALAAGAAAFLSWSSPAFLDRPALAHHVVADRGALVSLAWHDEHADVTVTRKGDGSDVGVQASVAEPGRSLPLRIYPGTTTATELLSRLRALPAARALGPLTEQQRKSFGLQPPQATLVLTDGQGQQQVAIGNPVFGSGDYYALGEQQQGYVLRSSTVSSLTHGAITLQDRELVGLKRGRIAWAALAAGGKRRTYVQRHKEDPQKAYFADPTDPDRKLEQVTHLIERALRLRITELSDSHPKGEPAVTLELYGDEGPSQMLASLTLYNETSGPMATSSRFAGPVLVQRLGAEALLSDAEVALNEGR